MTTPQVIPDIIDNTEGKTLAEVLKMLLQVDAVEVCLYTSGLRRRESIETPTIPCLRHHLMRQGAFHHGKARS